MLLLLAACALISDADLASRFDLDGDGVARPEDCNDDVANDAIPTWYPDSDGDGWGVDTGTLAQCVQPAGYAAVGGDCNDADNDVNPGLTWFTDLDGDGFGDPDTLRLACEQPTGTVPNNADCDDTRIDVSPTAAELCDDANVDEDCDGLADDDDPTATGQTAWYADADGDGLGTVFDAVSTCDQPPGYTDDRRDCDDADAGVTTDCRWVQVSAGNGQACGLRANGEVTCWATLEGVEIPGPGEPMTAITHGGTFACGLTALGEARCWGSTDLSGSEMSETPSGSYSAIDAGESTACVLGATGAVTCWGYNASEYEQPPSAGVVSISVSAGSPGYLCSLLSDGTIEGTGYWADPPGGTFLATAAFQTTCCTLDQSGTVAECEELGTAFPASGYATLSAGYSGACVLTEAGEATCLPDDGLGFASPPAMPFASVDVGHSMACGVTTDGFIECWGPNIQAGSTPPE